MPTFTRDHLRYYYHERGMPGAGRSLLLLHGFTGSSASWAPLMERLPPELHFIAPDLPGHGETRLHGRTAEADVELEQRFAMDAVARDLVALLDHLLGGRAGDHAQGVDLLGYSMGGRLALYAALAYPGRWRSLILESASPGLATAAERRERLGRDRALAERIEREGIASFVAFWETLPLFASQRRLPPTVRRAHRAARLRNRPAGLAASLRAMGTGVQPSLWERLGELQMAVLLLAGEEDAKFVRLARQMEERIPQARLVVVPQAGHTIHLERPDRYAALVAEWLAAS